jgi:hypothetical protein
MKMRTEVALPNTRNLYQDEGDLPVDSCAMYNKEEVDTECKLDVNALKKQIDAIERPDAVTPKKRNTEADDLGGDKWSEKERALNDSRVELDMEVNEWNPEYMYPSLGMPHDDRYLAHVDPPIRDWWSSIDDELPEDFIPEAAHVYTPQELTALAKGSTPSERKPRPWGIILQEARSLSSNMLQLLEKNEEDEPELRGNVRAIDGDYTDQEYVNLACLVDPGRELKWDTEQLKKTHTIQVIIDSYKIVQSLEAMNSKRKPQRKPETKMVVYKEWLKKYLGYFEPGYYEFIMTSLQGTKVVVLPNCLASDNQHDYDMQGKVEYHHEVVPLSKSQELCIVDQTFIDKYATIGSSGEYATQREFKGKIAKGCNPPGGFDTAPFPKCQSHHTRTEQRMKVPQIYYQITGVRADIRWDRSKKKTAGTFNKKSRNDKTTTRWLGLQNSKYVALPQEWVNVNVPDETVEEAWRRGMAHLKGEKLFGVKERFAKLPPGDTRDDDPPESIRCAEFGLNYYYQGKIDNCVMGSFANAICKMMGVHMAQQLLDTWVPTHYSSTDRWTKFQEHTVQIIGSEHGRVGFRKVHQPYNLKMNDSMPLLLQMKGNDGSETHAVTVYGNKIYDSASRYVLKKTQDTLEWCCGEYGYNRVLRIYVLTIEKAPTGKKRSRH